MKVSPKQPNNIHRRRLMWMCIHDVLRAKPDAIPPEVLADAIYKEIIWRVRPSRCRKNKPPASAYGREEMVRATRAA